MRIPLVDLAAQQAEITEEVRAGLDEVFATTAFIGGPAVGRFERAYAAAVEVEHCIGVATGMTPEGNFIVKDPSTTAAVAPRVQVLPPAGRRWTATPLPGGSPAAVPAKA